MFSNFWEEPFKLDGLHWNSVEHFYQASKFKNENPAFYEQFSLESGSSFCEDPAMAKSAGGKSGYSRKYGRLRPKNIEADSDFFDSIATRNHPLYGTIFEKRGQRAMFRATWAKFSQNEYLEETLIRTGFAKLLHQVPRSSNLIHFTHLEVVRANLMIRKLKIMRKTAETCEELYEIQDKYIIILQNTPNITSKNQDFLEFLKFLFGKPANLEKFVKKFYYPYNFFRKKQRVDSQKHHQSRLNSIRKNSSYTICWVYSKNSLIRVKKSPNCIRDNCNHQHEQKYDESY